MAIQRDSKLICTVCSSSFFYTAHAEQFTAGGYGSAEFRSITGAPKTLLVCAGCGSPVFPKPSFYSKGTYAAVSEEDFRESIKAGHKRRAASSVENIVNIAASPAEVQELRDQIEELRKAILAMAKPPVVIVPVEAQKPAKEKKVKAERGSTITCQS